jgi:hypothetical protein
MHAQIPTSPWKRHPLSSSPLLDMAMPFQHLCSRTKAGRQEQAWVDDISSSTRGGCNVLLQYKAIKPDTRWRLLDDVCPPSTRTQ